MNAIPDFVFRIVLSRNSLSCCTCGDNSEPNAAVAIRHPPPFSPALPKKSGDFTSLVGSDVILKELTDSSNLEIWSVKLSTPLLYAKT